MPCTAPGVPAGCTPDGETLLIPNVSTDAGLSPPFNSWFTLFGQFFDHGLDLTAKGGSGTVFVPLKDDDPLVAGPDGEFGTGDDLPPQLRFMTRHASDQPAGARRSCSVRPTTSTRPPTTTPPGWTRTRPTDRLPAQQVFLRDYALDSTGLPVSTGRLIQGASGGMATWAEIKTQARDLLGIDLVDTDVTNVPLVVTDPYGRFTRGPQRVPTVDDGQRDSGRRPCEPGFDRDRQAYRHRVPRRHRPQCRARTGPARRTRTTWPHPA